MRLLRFSINTLIPCNRRIEAHAYVPTTTITTETITKIANGNDHRRHNQFHVQCMCHTLSIVSCVCLCVCVCVFFVAIGVCYCCCLSCFSPPVSVFALLIAVALLFVVDFLRFHPLGPCSFLIVRIEP